MLTDDDLTRQLGAAFHGATDDLRYDGRVPTPRSRGAVAVPLVASAATVAALAGVWASAPDTDPRPATPSAGGDTAAATPDQSPRSRAGTHLVTDTIEVAGFTFTYQHAAGQPVADVLHVFIPDGLPDGAESVDTPAPTKAWVGTATGSGEVAIYLQSPDRFDGRLLGVSSPSLSKAQLVEVLRTGVS